MHQISHMHSVTYPSAPPPWPVIDVGIEGLTDDLGHLVSRLSSGNLMLSLHLVESVGLAPSVTEAVLRRVVGGQGRITQISPYDYVIMLLGPDEALLCGDSLPERLAAGLRQLVGPDVAALDKVSVRSLSTWTNEIVDPSWLLNELGNMPSRPLNGTRVA